MLHPKFVKAQPKQIFGAVLGAVGGLLANKSREREAEKNRDFQAEMSGTSYQRAMQDMKAAGLNPMLAYSQGGASVPVGAMAQVENIGASAAAAYQQQLSGEAAEQQADTSEAVGTATIEKTKQEISNLQSTKEQVEAITRNLGEEYQNLIKQGYNLTEAGNKIRAEVDKLIAETRNLNWEMLRIEADTQLKRIQGALGGLDLSAAQSVDNLGREAGQLKPVVDILRAILGAGKGR